MWSPARAKMFIHYTYKLDSKLYHKNFTQENLNLRLWLSRDCCLLYVLKLIKRRLDSSQWEWDSLCESAPVSLESWDIFKIKMYHKLPAIISSNLLNVVVGLNENGPRRLTCFSFWYPGGGTAWGGLGGMALLKKEWGFKRFKTFQAICFYFQLMVWNVSFLLFLPLCLCHISLTPTFWNSKAN